MSPDGSLLTRLTDSGDGYVYLQPTWSPDHSQIAFVSNRDGDIEIYAMKADGSSVRRLTYNPGEDSQPSWSPDGTKIAFVHGDDPSWAGRINFLNCEPAQIYVIKADGSGQKKLTGAANNTDPAWSPDSKQIAFSSDRDGNYEIYRMNEDGSGPTRLTFNAVEDADPAWSPDGSRIAYGSGYERVYYFCGIEGIIQNPFARTSVSYGGAGEIRVLRLDGTSDLQLTTTNNNSDPAWSPDNGQIVFASRRDGNFEIYLMDSNGNGTKRLTATEPADLSPAWSPHLPPVNSFGAARGKR
ncbi:MAG: PD40 domain-containing protein [Acidobacteria bacterium]|nr:PD40 domain-containing protein [Acidobacteriota bacterium]